MPLNKEAASAWLGWASIACWFFAQVPQMVENVRLQSCEGLALPFLLNWLFGDLTNLVGCILTNQLPFQTYIAAYFCFVDIMLTAQFFYYRRKSALLLASKRMASPRTPRRVRLRSQITSSFHSESVSPREALRSLSHTGKSEDGSTGLTLRPTVKRSRSSNPQHGNDLNALSEAAMEVAKAAERVQLRGESRRRRDGSRKEGRWAGSKGKRRRVDDEDEEGLGGSMLSEASGSTASVAQSPVLGLGMGMGTGTSRGRSTRRSEIEDMDDQAGDSSLTTRPEALLSVSEEEAITTTREKSRSQSHSIARGSRQRAAGVLFMGAFTMVGLMGKGEVSWKRTAKEGLISVPISRGEVLARTEVKSTLDWVISGSSGDINTFSEEASFTWVDKRESEYKRRQERRHQEIQHLIGRISAWICTTLYLTSRLPQIWKNYTRKSCEGLSVLLFVFAFLGNLTYVIGILVNPAGEGDPTEVAHYLLESLPYLLGSGGTLIFDLTIMLQSYLYRSAIPSSHHIEDVSDSHARRHRSHSRSHQHAVEEEPLIRQRSGSVDSAIRHGIRYTDGQ